MPSCRTLLGCFILFSVIVCSPAWALIGTKQLNYSRTTFTEAAANNGTIDNTSTLLIQVDQETFTGVNGENFVTAGKLAVSNVPAGLTVVALRTGSGTVEITLTGAASSHTAANNVANMTFTFQNSAFTGGNAGGVNNATRNDLHVSFLDPVVTLAAFTPTAHALQVAASSNITLTFNEAMSAASIVADSSVRVYGSITGRHTGSVSYNSGTFTATIDPASDFAPGEQVSVTVTRQVTNAGAYPLAAAVVWSFTVQSGPSNTLGSLVNVATVTSTIMPVAADLDQDGDMDIAAAKYTNNTIAVMINSGNRTFAAPVTYTMAASVRTVSVADVDNDGDMDLIGAIDNASLAILKNNGNGTFAAPVSYSVGQLPTWTDVTDIDGDGDLDIASGNYSSASISVITNNGNGEFSASTNYSAGTNAHGVRFADVDGDNDQDMIGAGFGADNIGVFLNNGSGTFGTITTFTTGGNPMDVRAADVDGDGDMDMITPNAGGNSVSILKNNGNGTFAAKTDYAVGLLPYMAIPADVDGDGDIDIAVACVNGLALNVLRNNGSGTFTAVSYPMGFGVAGLAAADMDGDGRLDIVISSHTDNLVKVLFGGAPTGKALTFNGTDGYGKVAIPTPTAYTIEMWVKPADVTSRTIGSISDGTGPATSYHTHLIGITSDHKFQHYLFDGSLQFVTGTTTVVAGRWYHVAITATNNGQMRLFVNGVEEGTAASIGTMFAGVNTYFFGMSSPQGAAYTGSMDNMRIWNYARSASQISGTMFSEISGTQSGLLASYGCSEPTATVAYDSSGNNRTLILKGSGYGWSPSDYPTHPAVVSLSPAVNTNTLARSGNITATFTVPMDNTSFVPGSTVNVFGSHSGHHAGSCSLSNGMRTMTFNPTADFVAGEVVEVRLTTGIQSADGYSLVAETYWAFTIATSTADTLLARVNYGTGANPYSATAADLDGDGDVDIAVVNYTSNTLSILKNNGDGTFAGNVDYGTGTNPRAIVSADLDGDGDMDLGVSNFSSHTLSVLKNNGDGTFGTKVDYGTGDYPYAMACADVDRDGDWDLAVTNSEAHTVSVLKNNGDATFAAKVDYASGIFSSYPYAVTSADIDADGDMDLAIANAGEFSLSVLKNNGDGTFPVKMNYAVGYYPYSVSNADIDGDGDLDLVAANSGSNSISIVKNNGDGTFAAHVEYGAGYHPVSVCSSDIDGDGDIDVVTANEFGNTLSVLKNVGNGTFGPNIDYGTGTNPRTILASDLDGDGDMDVAVLNGVSNSVSVFKGTTFAALPVELASFTAISRGSGVELRWKTATEVDNYGFDVERRTAQGAWVKNGFVAGSGTTNVPKEYQFLESGLSAGRYAYRLKQVDRSGAFSYSNEVEITVADAPARFALDQNYPNPFNPGTRIAFQLLAAGTTTLKVYDMLGKEVAAPVNGYQSAGEHTVDFNAASLPSGIYFYTLRSGSFHETRRMLLLK